MILSLDYINTGVYYRQGWFDGVVEHINSKIIKHLRIAFCLYCCCSICADYWVDMFLSSLKQQILQLEGQALQHALIK